MIDAPQEQEVLEQVLSKITIDVPTAQGAVSLEASPGRPLFILGRNGTGKSALVHRFVNHALGRAIYLPGSRPSYFESESLSLTPASRRQLTNNLLHWDSQPETRWKSMSGTSRNEKAVHDLSAAEAQFKIDAANEIARDGKDSKAVLRLQSGESPLDKVNALLAQSNLSVAGVMQGAELKVRRHGESYSVAKMSDGERAALVLIAEVVAAPMESVFIIDEPELHLHRAIVVPLISALLRERPDSTFLVSTHELELPAENPSSQIIMVRSCVWQNEHIMSWEIDIIEEAGRIPEDLRVDILGSRKKILFVEGDRGSLDRPLYALLFPSASIRSRESCREVERSVTGLRATEDAHHAEAFGLVDNDGMNAAQVAAYEAKNVYPLPVHAVESLYYAAEVIAAVAARQGETLGIDPSTLIADAKARGLAALDIGDRLSHLASRVAERQMRDALLQHLPDRTALISDRSASIAISIPSPFPGELARLQSLRSAGDLASIVSRYPIRESGVLDAIAKALRFPTRSDYERAALARVGADATLRNTLRGKLGTLASLLR